MRNRMQRVVAVTAATVAGSLGVTAIAGAAPTGDFADFADCPTANPQVQSCVYSVTSSGTFQLGNASVPINKSIRLRGGAYRDTRAPTGFRWVNPTGVDALQKVPLDVPGGLTGLVVPSMIQNIPFLGPIFNAAVQATNGVEATAEVVGEIQFGWVNYLTGAAPAITLPVRIKLDNPFLGGQCYVGSAGNPVTLRLTTGTTTPPAPNTPITGSTGTIQLSHGAQLATATGYSLVDNAFAVPAAEDCGPWGFRWAVTPIVNLKEGYPAAAGTNSATMGGNLKQAGAAAVLASEQ
jgi:hypothetical protein